MTDEMFSSELDRLQKAVADGEITACLGLADELNMAGHPYGEELCLIAEVVVTTPSMAVQANAWCAFLSIKNADKRDHLTDAMVAGFLAQVAESVRPEGE